MIKYYTIDMLIVNENKLENFLKRMSLESTIFVLDFDGTVTTSQDAGSFSPIAKTQGGIRKYMDEISDYYHPVEKASSFEDISGILSPIDKSLAKSGISFYDFRDILMQQWWDLTMLVWVKFKMDIRNYAIDKKNIREGMNTFLHYLEDNNLDFLIISAGIKNYIQKYFSHLWFDAQRVNIVANEFIADEDWRAIWYKRDLITAFTKQHLDYTQYNLEKKDFAIQFGDSLWDAHIVNDHFKEENILTIGFTNWDKWRYKSFTETFDIVLEEQDEGIEKLLKLLAINV